MQAERRTTGRGMDKVQGPRPVTRRDLSLVPEGPSRRRGRRLSLLAGALPRSLVVELAGLGATGGTLDLASQEDRLDAREEVEDRHHCGATVADVLCNLDGLDDRHEADRHQEALDELAGKVHCELLALFLKRRLS